MNIFFTTIIVFAGFVCEPAFLNKKIRKGRGVSFPPSFSLCREPYPEPAGLFTCPNLIYNEHNNNTLKKII